jgi:hypothetical protein
MSPNLLTEDAYKATFDGEMTNVTEQPDACVDIWPYVRLVQQSVELPQRVIERELVELVYRSESGHYDHVLIPTGRHNVYLAVIVDRVGHAIFGHRILDLNDLYSLDERGFPKHDA